MQASNTILIPAIQQSTQLSSAPVVAMHPTKSDITLHNMPETHRGEVQEHSIMRESRLDGSKVSISSKCPVVNIRATKPDSRNLTQQFPGAFRRFAHL